MAVKIIIKRIVPENKAEALKPLRTGKQGGSAKASSSKAQEFSHATTRLHFRGNI